MTSRDADETNIAVKTSFLPLLGKYFNFAFFQTHSGAGTSVKKKSIKMSRCPSSTTCKKPSRYPYKVS